MRGRIESISSVKDRKQIITVVGNGEHNGRLSMFEKRDNRWIRQFSYPCSVGAGGIADIKREGDNITPSGMFTLGTIFGCADNPGTENNYLKVNDDMYWVDDFNSEHYNQLVDIGKGKVDFASAEHLSDYPIQYKYAVAVDYNIDGIPGKGSAIFLHCTDNLEKGTSGCIAVDEDAMKKIIINLKNDAVIIIMG